MKSLKVCFVVLSMLGANSISLADAADSTKKEGASKTPGVEPINAEIKKNPKDGKLYARRASFYARNRDFAHALPDWNKAIELKFSPPGHGEDVYFKRALCLSLLKRFDAAIADYSTAIKMNPTYALAYSNRGACYEEQKNYPLAIKDYEQAIKINPKQMTAFVGLGEVSSKTGQHQKAVEYLNKAIDLNNSIGDSYYYRGVSLKALGKTSEAESDLAQAAKLGFKKDGTPPVVMVKTR